MSIISNYLAFKYIDPISNKFKHNLFQNRVQHPLFARIFHLRFPISRAISYFHILFQPLVEKEDEINPLAPHLEQLTELM
jgi:hypothetical protein